MVRYALIAGSLAALLSGCVTSPPSTSSSSSSSSSSSTSSSSSSSSSTSSTTLFATFNHPTGVAVEAGICNCDDDTLYVADYQSVRVVQGQTVTTLAGPNDASSASQCPIGYADGTGTAARFALISAIVRDATTGNLYVTEHTNNTVRRITPAGVVTTVAGQGPVMGPVQTPSVDGIGSAATFNHPTGITIDATGTYLYVADSYDYSIRRITIATQLVETVIGGQYLFPMVPSSGRLSNPTGIWYQPGTPDLLYVVDQGYGRIRYFDPSIYVPGTPLSPMAMAIMPSSVTLSLNHPAGIAIDASNRIFLGTGNGGSMVNGLYGGPVGGNTPIVAGASPSGDSGASIGLNARFNTPAGIALSPHNVLYIVDQRNNRIKRMGISPSYPVDVRAGHEPGNPNGCRDGLA